MSGELWVALFALTGTVIGTLGGIVASAKLTGYRLQQLEKKVDEHNQFAKRMPVVEEKLKVVDHRLDDLERKVEHE